MIDARPASCSDEVNDVVFLLTSDHDVAGGKWTVAGNATPVKTASDMVSFQLNKLYTGRQVDCNLPVCIRARAAIVA